MGKKLAIKGRTSRGKEVIDLLEMMGGKNIYNLHGLLSEFAYYFIDGPHNAGIRAGEYIFDDEDMYLFTCEEFWEKYPFKVGDKVKDGCGESLIIKSMSWSEDCETMVYDFEKSDVVLAAEDLLRWNKKESIEEKKINQMSLANCDLDEVEIVLGDKFELKIKDGKYYAVRKKPKYPDDYEECVRIAKNIQGYDIYIDTPTYRELMESFVKLLICRDAYWKIAGEEMGLDEPWEPDWNDPNQPKFGVHNVQNNIHLITLHVLKNLILVFPTEEMRDAFYENFKKEIEQCKELL